MIYFLKANKADKFLATMIKKKKKKSPMPRPKKGKTLQIPR